MPRNAFALVLVLFAAACGPAPAPDGDDDAALQTIAQAGDDALEVTLLAAHAPRVGWNRLHYRVVDKASGAAVRDASLSHFPLMFMTEMNKSHSSPFSEPVAEKDGWTGEVVFTMASGALGYWDHKVTVTWGEEAREVVFEKLPVADSDARKSFVFEPQGGEKENYVVTLNFAGALRVGMNDVVVTVHRKGEHGFPAEKELSLTIDPQMPTMGHGSSGNVHPAHVENGRYEGRVNLSMAGPWTVEIKVNRGGVDLGALVWDVEL